MAVKQRQYENWAMPLKCKRCGKLFGNWMQMLRHFSANKACSNRAGMKHESENP